MGAETLEEDEMSSENKLLKQYCESKRIITQAMEDHQLVLFVGAGASMAAGMPSWSDAVRTIADRLSITHEQLDYLRIPQYYYNARGKKEYTQLMREIFKHGDYLTKHEIHDKIIAFNTETIITTNYDHLIEQAAEDNSQILSVVSKDADLPYRKGGKELIKMHGDFENDNFVLKEDDYLSYSRNFKLIENYVKSLIGTKVVLFVGYSFSDPDLKLIFSWVKDILGGDFQRAYLIESGKEYDVNEEEYFRNFGINLLYASIQLQGKYTPYNLTNNLLLMLEWLLYKENTDKLTILYSELKPFISMRYACQKYIRDAFYKVGIITDGGILRLDDIYSGASPDIKNIFVALAYGQWVRMGRAIHLQAPLLSVLSPNAQSKSASENEIYQKKNNSRVERYFRDFKNQGNKFKREIAGILNVISKSNITAFKGYLAKTDGNLDGGPFYIPTISAPVPKWMEYVNIFDFNRLKTVADDNMNHLSETNPDLYMEQGYIQFILEDYHLSYNCYKNAKRIFYKCHEYVKFFVAEFNRYLLGKIIIRNGVFYGIAKSDVEVIRREVESMNLDRIFNSLPDLGETNRALKDLYTFNVAYSLFQDAYISSEKVTEQAKTKYSLFVGEAAFSGMRERIFDYYNYISFNLLPVNNYSEHINIFRVYFQSIISSAMVTDKDSDGLQEKFESIHPKALEAFDILVGLKFVEQNVIAKLLLESPINIPLAPDAIKYLEIVTSNCGKRTVKSILTRDNIFWKIITILSKSILSETIVKVALKKMCEIAQGMDYRVHATEIIGFISNAHKQRQLSGGLELLNEFTCNIFEFLERNKSETSLLQRLLFELLCISKEQGQVFDRDDLIKPLVSEESRLLCATIYPVVGERSKKIINDAYSNWKMNSGDKRFEFYYALVNNGIIKPDAQAEKEIYDYYNKTNYDDSKFEGTISLPVRNYSDFLYCLLDLSVKGLIIDRESCRELIKARKVIGADWLMDYKGYDYSKFDINWLIICSDKLLDVICNDTDVRDKIRQCVEKAYIAGNVDQRVVDIYFAHLT